MFWEEYLEVARGSDQWVVLEQMPIFSAVSCVHIETSSAGCARIVSAYRLCRKNVVLQILRWVFRSPFLHHSRLLFISVVCRESWGWDPANISSHE